VRVLKTVSPNTDTRKYHPIPNTGIVRTLVSTIQGLSGKSPLKLRNIFLNYLLPALHILLLVILPVVAVCVQVKATHAYKAEDADELSFDADEVISVIPIDNTDEQARTLYTICSSTVR